MQDADLFNLLVQLFVLAGAGFVGCYVAQRLGTARIVGGLIAGLLIGPTLLGNLAPDAERWLWKGAQTERAAFASLEAEYESAVKASIISGVSEIHREILKEEYEPRIGEAAMEVVDAESSHRSKTQRLAILAAAVFLLAVGRNGLSHDLIRTLPRASFMAIGIFAIPIAGTVVAASIFDMPQDLGGLQLSVAPWIPIAAISVLVSSVAVPMNSRLRDGYLGHAEPSDAERVLALIQLTTAIVTAVVFLVVVALLVCGRQAAAAAFFKSPPPSVIGLFKAMPIILAVLVGGFAAALAVTWFASRLFGERNSSEAVPAVGVLFVAALLAVGGAVYTGLPIILGALAAGLAFGSLANASEIVKRHLAPLADGIALPVLCAYIGTRIDLIPHFDWVWVLVALIIFGDGKATGVMLVGRYVCRLDWRASMRMGTILAAGGAVPLIVALMVYEAGVIDQTLFVALVIANAVTAAFAAPVLRMIDAYFASSAPEPTDGFSDD